MSLEIVQAAMAKLFTQAALREQFARDPLCAARALGLDEADAADLSRLAPEALKRFARSLIGKRIQDARKFLPSTALALGDDFAPRLRETLKEPPPGAAPDALGLVASLAREPREAQPWIADLARYEAGFIEDREAGWGLRWRLFAYHPPSLMAELRFGRKLGAREKRRSLAVWARAPDRRLWHRCWAIK